MDLMIWPVIISLVVNVASDCLCRKFVKENKDHRITEALSLVWFISFITMIVCVILYIAHIL